MAALQSEGEAQKLRFGPWLLSAISSGNYPGLCWIDQDHSVFRVPWKHNARKDVTSSDVEIFKLEPALQEMAPEITLPGSTNPAQPSVLEDVDKLQWVLQLCNISRDPGPLAPSWPSADAPHQDILLQHHPDPSQNNCLPPPACQQWVPATQQPALGAYSPLDPMLLEHQAPMPLPCHPPEGTVPVLSPGEAMLFTPTHPVPPPPPPPEDNTDVSILDVSIYYRGKLFHQEEVGGRQCLLVYQPCDPAVAQRPGHLVRFPSPTELADSKQRELTEQLLGVAGLQLEQRASKLFATRLKKCKVFWALSHQLEGVKDPPPNMLCRDQATPIFDFNEFCTELRDFRNGQRQRSPDFTIYLCFGQFFSKDKPKESRLILVKLVPKFCEYWYEQVQREGASSLDSGTVSLQLSDSFSLFELIEQYTMQMD
ncbi:interferon regulatory factor 7 isoform X5 [Larus michahellis]|uniref:interferon regulatory factor 7 isoform X5 n=1 Tax=Larus michahellis TaxID=119627 RepID=UPI003D9B9F52